MGDARARASTSKVSIKQASSESSFDRPGARTWSRQTWTNLPRSAPSSPSFSSPGSSTSTTEITLDSPSVKKFPSYVMYSISVGETGGTDPASSALVSMLVPLAGLLLSMIAAPWGLVSSFLKEIVMVASFFCLPGFRESLAAYARFAHRASKCSNPPVGTLRYYLQPMPRLGLVPMVEMTRQLEL